MKKLFIAATLASLACGPVAADVCTDLSTQYASLILRLEQDTALALTQTTDPAEQQAIRASFDAQKTALQAEEASALSSAGCGTTTTNPPPTGGGTTPTPTPTPPTTGDTGGSGSTGGSRTCDELMQEVRAEAHARCVHGFSEGARYVHSRQAEIDEACGNYGHGRRQVGGHDDRDGRSCDRDRDGHR
ncbi:MAG: hypothetical protein JO102_05120 [Elusimicrobia bacterium]|nr:hypothetical protein [Elusimicrobiota bacterium]